MAANNMSADDALADLVALQDHGVILVENDPPHSSVWLEGWNPTLQVVGGDGNAPVTGLPRTDCHGQGRAVEFVGVAGTFDGIEYGTTVLDNWSVDTPATPGGDWPAGTGADVHYRLDEPDQDPFTAQFYRSVYGFVTGEWQDQSDTSDDTGGSSIGDRSFVMHPDHPATAPGKPHGREAHKNHLHLQIGVTGTA